MIARVAAAIVLFWALGFLWFAVFLPMPAGPQITDAIVVPTGGQGRIDRGLDLLREEQATQMLVTGVDLDVKPREFAAEYNVNRKLMDCCITLGFAAVDTRGNAAETAEWIRQRGVKSLRLVTTDWHMRRAAFELGSEIPGNIVVVEDAVRSRPSLRTLFLEYNKLIASMLSRAWPG
jgi:uncharacterized SAM-binding protein YcdF (DUF218 family)